jgi:hypothetical protein
MAQGPVTLTGASALNGEPFAVTPVKWMAVNAGVQAAGEVTAR